MKDPAEYELLECPEDPITQICFDPHNKNILAVTSWDNSLRIYNVESNQVLHKFECEKPILACCFGEDDVIYFGGLDCLLYSIDLKTNERVEIGCHFEAISCICWSALTKRIYTGSWDKTVRVWDPKIRKREIQINLPERVFSMDIQNNKLALALGNLKISIYDLMNLEKPWLRRDGALNYMLKCIRLMPDDQGFVCSSIDGRMHVEYFDKANDNQNIKYAFKCHCLIHEGTSVVYPVNALAMHPRFNIFASGGSDSVVYIWDGKRRKRLQYIPGYPNQVACLDFSNDGSLLAIACSYTFDEGEKDPTPNSIFIRRIEDEDVTSRTG